MNWLRRWRATRKAKGKAKGKGESKAQEKSQVDPSNPYSVISGAMMGAVAGKSHWCTEEEARAARAEIEQLLKELHAKRGSAGTTIPIPPGMPLSGIPSTVSIATSTGLYTSLTSGGRVTWSKVCSSTLLTPPKDTEEEETPPVAPTLDIWNFLDTHVKDLSNVLLWGPPGTGKSSWAFRKAAQVAGLPVFRAAMHLDLATAELRGHFVANAHGGWQWMHGPAVLAWTTPGILLLDELIDAQGQSASDCWSFLHAILDDEEIAHITLPTGVHLKPSKGFRCIATCNADPKVLPEALLSRFQVIANIVTPHPELMERLRMPPGSINPNTGFTARHLLNFDSLVDRGVEMETAAKAVFGDEWRESLDAVQLARAKWQEEEDIDLAVTLALDNAHSLANEVQECDIPEV